MGVKLFLVHFCHSFILVVSERHKHDFCKTEKPAVTVEQLLV